MEDLASKLQQMMQQMMKPPQVQQPEYLSPQDKGITAENWQQVLGKDGTGGEIANVLGAKSMPEGVAAMSKLAGK